MTDRRRGWLLVASQLALLGVLVLTPTGTAWTVPDGVRLLGAIGRITGAALIVLGGIRLGVSASVHPAPTTQAVLRTDGAYRYARHPIYTGVLVLGAAIALTGGSFLHVVALVALFGVLSLKSRFEERLLIERFPLYRDYAMRTGRFLPFPTRRPRSAMEIEGERSIDIAAPPELVWSLVADITAMGRWSPITRAAAWVPPAEGPVEGARFTGTNRLPIVGRWTSTATITRCVPGQSFDFAVGRDVHDPNTTWSYQFEPTPTGGTTVTERWQMLREPGIVLVYYRLIGQAARIAAGVEETLRSLKTAAEADHETGLGPPP